MVSRQLWSALGLVAAALALAGCGVTGGGGRSVTVHDGDLLTVRVTEYRFDPQNVTLLGRRLRVRLVNDGSLAHNWQVVEEFGDNAKGEPIERNLGGTQTFQGGAERTISLHLKPGAYRILCTVGNHEDLGERGTLRVR